MQRLQRLVNRATAARVGTRVGEVGDKGLAKISGAAAVRGWHGVIDVVCADSAVVTVPVKQERLCKPEVVPAGTEGGQWLVQALCIHVIA